MVKRLKTARHLKHDLTQVALCEDGGLFVSSSTNAGPQQQASWRIFELDRERGEWSLIPRNEKWGILFGCDREELCPLLGSTRQVARLLGVRSMTIMGWIVAEKIAKWGRISRRNDDVF